MSLFQSRPEFLHDCLHIFKDIDQHDSFEQSTLQWTLHFFCCSSSSTTVSCWISKQRSGHSQTLPQSEIVLSECSQSVCDYATPCPPIINTGPHHTLTPVQFSSVIRGFCAKSYITVTNTQTTFSPYRRGCFWYSQVRSSAGVFPNKLCFSPIHR